MTDNCCDRCGLPAWKPHGGMGGSIMPDPETHCLKRDGMDCRSRRIAYLNGIQKGIELAKDEAYIAGRGSCVEIEWSAVDEELEELLRQKQ